MKFSRGKQKDSLKGTFENMLKYIEQCDLVTVKVFRLDMVAFGV